MNNRSDALHVRHRPQIFDEVIGHDSAVQALLSIIERKTSRVFLLFGPSGVGKTTMARIIARMMGVIHKDIIELDAATHTGIDDIRALQDSMQYLPFGKGKLRATIVDEAHGLSRQAWDSLLKVIEEPPSHVLWIFCTTQVDKIPDTIRSRCSQIGLKPMTDDDLHDLVDKVCKLEKIKLPDGFADMIVKKADGSARQTLVNLGLVRDTKDRKAAIELLESASESDATVQLCRFLLNGKGSWVKAMKIVDQLEDQSPESIRISVCAYMAVVMKKADSDRAAMTALQIMEAFSYPYIAAEKQAPLLRSIGQVIFSGE